MPHYNIAFYSDTYLPAMDGVVSSMLNFKKELEKRGNSVYIFASRGMGGSKSRESKDVFLYPGVRFKPYPQYSVALFPYYSSLKLKNLGIDILHAQTPFIMGFNSLIAARVGGYPLVGTFNTLINSKSLSAYYPKNRALKRFYARYIWKYTKFFYRRCDITIAPSQAIAMLLKKHNIKNTTVVPNSVDLKRFSPRVSGEKLKEKLGIRGREKVVLYLGRVSKEKKLEVLLRAAKVILKNRNDVLFVVGGTGPAIDEYKNMAKTLGIRDRVKFLGFVNQNTLPSLYAASNLLCLPSIFETQGLVSLEAMAVGKPVVGADYLALREIIQNGKNGERFEAGNHISCARKIEKVLNNCEAYRRNAINTAKRFSVERVTDELLSVYDSVFSNGRFTD